MKFCLTVLLAAAASAAERAPEMPMKVNFRNSAEFAWLNKKVLDARSLDQMSDPKTWSFRGQGSLTFPEGRTPLGFRRLRVEVNIHDQQPATGRSSGLPSVLLRRVFPGEDWTGYNRISFWIRPELSGFYVLPILVVLRNDGVEKVPDVYGREGNHYVTLPDRQWTRVLWEITPLARDKVTSLDFYYWVNKRIPDPSDRVAFEIAQLELERVPPDHFEGWNVAPGRISFSHTGYQSGASKTAVASRLPAREFTVISTETGETVLRKPLRTLKGRLGEFQLLDFSELRRPGSYMLKAGDALTRPFRVGGNVWRETIWKTINFFYAQRCGLEIPGLHEACHRDWLAVLGDRRIVMNGGWHDAGDLSQGLVHTAEAVYAMFALARRLQAQGQDPVLLKRLIEEARWGLDWVLKVRFPGGYRIGFASMNIWTNGIIGDADDRTREAFNNPNLNYLAAAAQAIAHNVLNNSDPLLAARCLRTAEQDWLYAVAGKETPENLHTPAYAATEMELAAVGILASLELYQATGRAQYAHKARELARTVVESQQKTFIGRQFPLAGFFYTAPDRQTIFHQFHRANDQAPIVAMARLCELFPDDPDWMKWYSVAALHSEYQKRTARTTEPYGVLPAYVYRDGDCLKIAEGDRYQSSREACRRQVLQGMPMGEGYYLKAFPVWFARRGNYGVLLSQAKALSAAAHLRRDLAAAGLAHKQLEWVVGRNPFAQSTMWGEGYDFAQQYSVSSGDIVGSLPVGIMTRGDRDAPYWPAQNCYVYKEVWVHPSARWLWLMEDLAGPALVEGLVGPGAVRDVEFREALTGEVTTVRPDPARGAFRVFLPEGEYQVRAGEVESRVTLLPAGTYSLDLRPERALDFSLTQETRPDGGVTIRLTARGAGRHTFALRTENLRVDAPEKALTLRPNAPGELVWTGRVEAAGAPWVAVVIADGDVSHRRDVVGARPAGGRRE